MNTYYSARFRGLHFLLISFFFLCQSVYANTQDVAGWEEYYEWTQAIKQPRPTLEKAIVLFQEEGVVGVALDLGAGAGRDTIYLLKNQWTVLAVDAQPAALRMIAEKVVNLSLPSSKFIPILKEFETFVFPQSVQLVNASYSLPFCHPAHFPAIWENLVNSLEEGGRFAGQFFGERDAWAQDSSMTFLTKEEVKNLFKGRFAIEYFREEKGVRTLINGEEEYCHVFHVVAKKL